MAHQLEFDVLDDESIGDELDRLHDWLRDGATIRRTFQFDSFMAAIDFVNRVAAVAERMNHHPDFEIHYKDVTLRCWTHKKNAVTKADIALAHEIEKVV